MASAPADVLCSVFELLPFVDRVYATHVCKHWRMVSLSSPGTLWSRIVSDSRRVGVLRQLLDRSRQAPVDVEVLLRNFTYEDAMAAISQHLFHIRRLCLYSRPLGQGQLAMRNVPRIYAALAVPAPILQHLDIGIAIKHLDPDEYHSDDSVETDMEDVRNFDYRIPVNLFAGCAPSLRRVAWRSMILPHDGVPAFADVTHFSFAGRALSASHLVAIVGTLPHLTSLRIKVDYGGYELPSTRLPGALCLEEMELDIWNFASRQSLAPLLRYLNYHRANLVTAAQFPEWLDLFLAPPRGLPHALRTNDTWAVQTSWQMLHPGGYVSQGHTLFTDTLLETPLARDMFSALETLVLHISTIAHLSVMPPLSRLLRLFLCCRGAWDGERFHAIVLALAQRPSSFSTLTCPNLRTMEIRDPEPDSVDTPTVEVDDVQVLVEHIFTPVPDPRPHVTLRNVNVPFPRPERFWGRPIADALTVTNEFAVMPMEWDGGGWNIRLSD